MSLTDRVQAAGNAEVDAAAQQASQLDCLREYVQNCVSSDAVATLAIENPERARNEVRTACRQAFAEKAELAGISQQRRAELTDELIDVLFGLGPIEGLLADEAVTEIMVNGTQSVYFEREGRLRRSAALFSSDAQVRALIDRIIGPLGRRIDEASPMVDARLPQGHRVNAVIPPIAIDGPLLTIRTFSERVITLEEMERQGSIEKSVHAFLKWLVVLRKNVAVVGGTGSGKTTLLNALSCCIPHSERVVTIEDSAELRFLEHPHVVRLEARPRNAEGMGEVSIRELVANALRMRPDRIIVGECRGAEALDVLQAMNTGHDGSLSTLHANAPAEAIQRLVTMVRYGAEVPVDVVEAQIAGALDVIVQVARGRDGGRYVIEIAQVSFDDERRRCVVEPLYRRRPGGAAGVWRALPAWLNETDLWEDELRKEVELWKGALRLPRSV